MKLILKISIGLIFIASIIWIVWRMSRKPDISNLEKHVAFPYEKAETSYPENYDSLVLLEKNSERSHDCIKEIAWFSDIQSLKFPYFSKQLDLRQTHVILNILYDSSSYIWGEFGTPDYDILITYYDLKEFDTCGYTLIDKAGEVKNYPYRSLMKWGALSEKGKTRLFNAID